MKLSNKHFKPSVCLFPILLTTFLVACGGGGLDPILGSDAANTATPGASTPATPGGSAGDLVLLMLLALLEVLPGHKHLRIRQIWVLLQILVFLAVLRALQTRE